jgi:hypothetical protein
LVGAATALVWIVLAATMVMPANLTNHVLSLGDQPAEEGLGLRERLLAIPGVEDAVVALDEGVAYLKVDSGRLDWATLQTFSARA